jgi:hypothetical protein
VTEKDTKIALYLVAVTLALLFLLIAYEHDDRVKSIKALEAQAKVQQELIVEFKHGATKFAKDTQMDIAALNGHVASLLEEVQLLEKALATVDAREAKHWRTANGWAR